MWLASQDGHACCVAMLLAEDYRRRVAADPVCKESGRGCDVQRLDTDKDRIAFAVKHRIGVNRLTTWASVEQARSEMGRLTELSYMPDLNQMCIPRKYAPEPQPEWWGPLNGIEEGVPKFGDKNVVYAVSQEASSIAFPPARRRTQLLHEVTAPHRHRARAPRHRRRAYRC